MSKGSQRRKENFKQVQDNWPASMGKKPYWATYSHFSNKFYNENKELIEDNLKNICNKPTNKDNGSTLIINKLAEIDEAFAASSENLVKALDINKQ
jgi:hypothetical protein